MRKALVGAVGMVGAAILVASVSLAAQSSGADPQAAAGAPAKGPAKSFVPKRLPWGDPDLSGNFTTKDEANTPLERPAEFAGRRLEDITPAELEKINEARRRKALADAPYPGGGSRAQGVAIAVPVHWFDSLDTTNTRPWFITDPPDGKIPPLTEQAKKRTTDRAAARKLRGTADSYTDRSVGDRCISFGIPALRPFPTLYGNSIQVLQTKDYVAIRYEMIHESRIIPIAGRSGARPHAAGALTSYFGDAVGHWEGDTLVIETTNFNDNAPSFFFATSPNLRTVERLRRVAPSKIDWSVTLEDSTTWTRPWTFAIMWTEDDTQAIFEYACHEGNYGLRNILSAGRSDDAKGIKSSDSVDTQGDLVPFQE
jgi:hypothetical protein